MIDSEMDQKSLSLSSSHLGHLRATNGEVFEPASISNGEDEAKERAALVEWLKSILPNISLPINASDEELRQLLIDGTVLCRILNRMRPGYVIETIVSDRLENVKRFLAAMDGMGLPRFQIPDLEKGSMKIVLECLLTLRAHFMPNTGGIIIPNNGSPIKAGTDASMIWKNLERLGVSNVSPRAESPREYSSSLFGEDKRKGGSDSRFQRALHSSVPAEPSASLLHQGGHKFQEVFQFKQGNYADIPAANISEMMKSNSLDNAPTQSLLSVVNGILDESVERKNGEIPYRVACLLRKVVQEIERRISTQAEHLRTQNNLFKAREEKYQSRIRVLEALASGTCEETQIVMNQLQQIKSEKSKMEERKRVEEQDVVRLMKEKDRNNEEIITLMKEKTQNYQEILRLKQELEASRKEHQDMCLQMETGVKGAQTKLVEKLKAVEDLLTESRSRVKELEDHSEAKNKQWIKKDHLYQICTEFELGTIQELRSMSESIKQEIIKTQESYSEEFDNLGTMIKALHDAAAGYYDVLAENRKLHNELQELKGNIRVYCRTRPFLPGQNGKQPSTIEYIGENGELVVSNPSKGKEGHRTFKFNKVYGPAATQVDVFKDTQPLVQSVLDGYNVCIFAYGQTGSGKTYTMTGPDGATKEHLGVNYRALNELFRISQSRESNYSYEICVQMVEIYNEQVRDLLQSGQKKLGILATSQPSGLAVPDAAMHPVQSTSDVMEIMEIGLKNRARGATALNERSSRSHSIVTIHVHGTDLKSSSSLRASLHLVDLAGSERVDRSEVTGDRLKEAQHINKSLSALGDVIFALSQKSPHVPYRNSKLTQLLQSSLGGQAKTLMFVQLNPEHGSYTETMGTLKFAERVSGVELGAAKSTKEGRDVRELMEQVSSLKEAIAQKDEEIERLQLLKEHKNVSPNANGEKHGTSTLRYGSSSPIRSSIGGTAQRKRGLGHVEKVGSQESLYSDSSQRSAESFRESNSGDDIGQNYFIDAETLELDHTDYEERQSDISDAGLSVGTETEGSDENFDVLKRSDAKDSHKSTSRLARPTPLKSPKNSSKTPPLKSPTDPAKLSTGMKKTPSGTNISKPSSKRWH